MQDFGQKKEDFCEKYNIFPKKQTFVLWHFAKKSNILQKMQHSSEKKNILFRTNLNNKCPIFDAFLHRLWVCVLCEMYL